MASKSLGTLTIDLIAKTGGFVAGMDKAERSSEKWRRQVESHAKAAGAAIGAASVVAVGAMAAWVKSSINNAAEIQNLAKVAGSSTTEFQKFAAGARTVGIENDKLADILKDVNDKVGDFLVTGGGELKEFFESVAPKVGVTAEQFRNLSGPQALGLYVDTLEKAGANQQEMTFFLEAIANDATLLAPLLRNGGKEMRGLADEAQNLGLILSEETIAGAKQFNDDLDLLGRVAGGVGQQIAAELLPDLLDLTNTLRDPETAKAAAAMAKAVVGSFSTIIEGARETVQFIKWAAESAAAFMNGIAADDIVRLNDEIERLQKMKEGGALDKLVFFGRDGLVSYYDEQELDAEIAKLQAAVDAAMAGSRLTVPEIPEPATGGGTGLSIPLSPSGTGGGKRSADSSKAASEAAREAEKAIRAQQAALDAVDAAQERNNQEAAAILESLMSEEEQIKQSYNRRRQIILDATLLTEEERTEALLRLEKERDDKLIEVNGSYWERYLKAAEENLQSFDELSGVMLEDLTGRFGDAFESMVFDSQNLGDAISGMAEGMARSVVNALGEMAAQWLAYQAVQILIGDTATKKSAIEIAAIGATKAAGTAATTATVAEQSAAATATATAWTPAAIAASIGSFGSAAAIGLAAVVAALAFSGGFRKGGYTGGGGVDDIAGVVHGKEFVFDAEATSRIGVANLEAIRKGRRVESTIAAAASVSSREGGGTTVNVIEDASKRGTTERSVGPDGREEVNVFVADIFGDGPRSKAIAKKFGLNGVGR